MGRPDSAVPDDEFERELQHHQLRPESLDGQARGSAPARILVGLVVVTLIGFWAWAFSPWAPRGHPDELADPAFPALAEELCSSALEDMAEVPLAFEATSLEDRAGQIEATTAILAILVEDLTAAAPPAGTEDGAIIHQWLGDWRIYLSDRLAYASDFRAGIDSAFAVTTVNGDQVTKPIDLFATINRMPSCSAPLDV